MAPELTESDIFVLLSNRRRRLLLRLLRESSTPLTAMDLAERIAEREDGYPSERRRQAVYLTLYHNHLPRLDADDVITFDETDGTVAPGLNFDHLVHYLAAANDWNHPHSGE